MYNLTTAEIRERDAKERAERAEQDNERVRKDLAEIESVMSTFVTDCLHGTPP